MSWLQAPYLPRNKFHPTTVQILRDVSTLTAIREQTHGLPLPPSFSSTTTTPPISTSSFSAELDQNHATLLTKRALIEQRLLALAPASDPFRNPRHNDHMYESCRLAALIYTRAVNHLIPFADRANHSLMRKLRLALEHTDLDGCWGHVPGALMSLLLVGGAAAVGDRERMWYMAHLMRVSMSVGQSAWADVQESIMKVIWVQGIIEEAAGVR
ncbi:MAG: hypothetical protein L6R40_008820 [Gallowayella cf. fulva]|nr:MAG: hypothetical protein L6R40_008820 [Xanthomendoza cf. fulva]